MRAHNIDSLQFSPNRGSFIAFSIIFGLILHGLAKQGKWFEAHDVFDALVDGIPKGFIPDLSSSDAISQGEGFEGESIIDFYIHFKVLSY